MPLKFKMQFTMQHQMSNDDNWNQAVARKLREEADIIENMPTNIERKKISCGTYERITGFVELIEEEGD